MQHIISFTSARIIYYYLLVYYVVQFIGERKSEVTVLSLMYAISLKKKVYIIYNIYMLQVYHINIYIFMFKT